MSRLDIETTYIATGSIAKTATEHKLSYYAARNIINEMGITNSVGRPSNESRKQEPAPVVGGRVHARTTPTGAWKQGQVKRYFLTCAQNNTALHDQVWDNILGLADLYDAELLVARTVYNRFSMSSAQDKKLIIERNSEDAPAKVRRDYWWDAKLTPYIHDERLELAPGLIWCGETNTTPTAADPLSGFDSYTGRASSIFPHPRVAMRSVPSMMHEPTKLMYTTGTVTQRNYIQRKAGQLADFHHCYGGLLVEIDRDGVWFVRQVIANEGGVMCDLDKAIDSKGHITKNNRILAANWGDIHSACPNPYINKACWGEGGLVDWLRPETQVFHDLVDFRARNPHMTKKQLYLDAFIEAVRGNGSVMTEMLKTAEFLRHSYREGCMSLVVDSNHDHMLIEWLERTGDFRKDPTNAVYFLRAAHHLWSETAKRGGVKPNMTQWAMLDADNALAGLDLRFLNEDESFVIGDGIELGLHGHEGFNGARSGPKAFARLGCKLNAGHVHSAGIWDGAWFSGITGDLNQRYNVGLSGWTHTHTLTYGPSGKRAQITMTPSGRALV